MPSVVFPSKSERPQKKKKKKKKAEQFIKFCIRFCYSVVELPGRELGRS